MHYMLDTNICVHLIQRHPSEVAARFSELRHGEVVMSAITHAELRYGVERSDAAVRDRADRALRGLIEDIPVLPFDTDAGEAYGVLRAAVRERKRDALDRLIASHALSRGLILVTNNEADFKDYPGLRLENWLSDA
ncbi:MAG: type II toxin-antitoxin system VapC family toxin [Pseudomonadota bacterium]